jgi:hypothetical protein
MNVVEFGGAASAAGDPYGVEASQIARRQQLAQLLLQQSINGGPVYSSKAGIARALQGALAGFDQGQADKAQRELADKREGDRQQEFSRIFDAAQNPDRSTLAKLLTQSKDPGLSQAGLGMLLKGPSKLEWKDAGDRMVAVDEGGNIVRQMPKGVTPDAKYGKETVGADTRFTRETPSADALLTDTRAKAEGAANRGVTLRGQDLTNERSVDQNAAMNSQRNVTVTEGVRKEFEGLPEVKNYKAVVPIVQSARKAPNTPAGDIDMIYAVGKIMDPNSVVREGELNLVIAAGSPAQKLQGMVNYVKGGGRLAPEQRAQLMDTITNRTGALKQQYDAARGSYEDIVKRQGLDPAQVFTQISADGGGKSVVRTGTLNGRKVVQYSDGTTDYAP